MILPISVVIIEGATTDLVADVANANTVWVGECGVFVDVVAQGTVSDPRLLILDQNDCLVFGHVVSAEEDELFSLGRNTGADVTVYYVSGDVAGFRGCAAHPPGRRGCWVGDAATDWTFIHELTHVVGGNLHVGDTDNLMLSSTSDITNLPPDLTEDQCRRILDDPALLNIPSIVLNL
jgi:hypothetical protein